MKTNVIHIDDLTQEFIKASYASHLPIPFPTETVFGLGAAYDDLKTIQHIFDIKGRPSSNPLIVHISDISMLEEIVSSIPEDAKVLMSHFFPGPLTLIFKKNQLVHHKITGNQDTVAVRMPSHPVAKAFIEKIGKPVVAPSANISGRPSSTKVSHVLEDFMGKVMYIIDGESSEYGIESTILDVTRFPYTILRPGVITSLMIEDILKKPLNHHASEILAPGMKFPHYQPNAQVIILEGSDDAIIAYMKEKKHDLFIGHDRFLSYIHKMLPLGHTHDIMKHQLYDVLRQTNAHKVEVIYTHSIDDEAYMNRLLKAANFHVLKI